MYRYKTVAVKALTYKVLQDITKYRESMDDVVIKAALSFALANHIETESITQALLIESKKDIVGAKSPVEKVLPAHTPDTREDEERFGE